MSDPELEEESKDALVGEISTRGVVLVVDAGLLSEMVVLSSSIVVQLAKVKG